MLLSEFLPMWLKIYRSRISSHTYIGYQININHCISVLGNRDLSTLKTVDIQMLYSSLLEKLSGTSVLYVHRVLREALEYAVSVDLISKNPCQGVLIPRKNIFVSHVLDEFQVQLMLSYCRSDVELYVPVLLAVSLGLRRGEILGLRYSDIDIENFVLHVQRSSEVVRGVRVDGSTKTFSSRRSILLSQKLCDELLFFRDDSSDYVCKLSQNQIQYRFSKLMEALKISNIRFHDLRHTNATLLLKKGIPAKIVSERLGHSSITVTLDLYSHVLTDMQAPAADVLDSIF